MLPSEHVLEPAVDQQLGDDGVVRQREGGRHQLGEIGRLDHLAARHGGDLRGHVGGDEARADGRRAHAVVPAEAAHRVGEGDDGELAHRVAGVGVLHALARQRGEVDDAPAPRFRR